MRAEFKTFWQWLFIRLLRGMEWLSYHLPRRVLLGVGYAVGALAYRCSDRYRKVAIKNLTFAYGDAMPIAEKKRITREVFINFAKSAVEFPLASRMSDQEIRALVDFSPEDSKMLRQVERDHGSYLGISAHFGNFELMARRYVAEGFICTVVVRNDPNPEIAQLLNDYRQKTGYRVIGRGSAIRTVLKKLRGQPPESVVMLPDQKSDDVFVPFFGKIAGTVGGPALIALRAKCPIIPVFCVRLPGDRHKLVFGEHIVPVVTGDTQRDIENLMTQINFAIETIVREYPEQWLWLHDRWKMPPPDHVKSKQAADAESTPELSPV